MYVIKKREGLEQVRVRSQHDLLTRHTFTTMATLLLEMAGTRRKGKVKQVQLKLPKAAGFKYTEACVNASLLVVRHISKSKI
jgi:hypothetical protein